MKIRELEPLRDKLFFTKENVEYLLGISRNSASVFCSRYEKRGIFVRLKKNLYIMDHKWGYLDFNDNLAISNILQVPSYVSCMTALSFYEITTQTPRDYFESISVNRSITIDVKDKIFKFYKLKRELYFDFRREGSIFIASREKALIDMLYLFRFGKYSPDFSSIDFDKFNGVRMRGVLSSYPLKLRRELLKLWKNI